MRVLIVEDEALIAIEIESILSGAGYAVVGPVATVRDAMRLLGAETPQAAVLDVNLGRETSEAVAHELNQRGVPFLAVSGYAVDQRPAVFDSVPFLAKPFRASDLVASVKKLRS